MTNCRIMPCSRLFRWISVFVLILTALPMLLACGSTDEPTPERETRRASTENTREPARTRESRIFSSLMTRESTPAPTERLNPIVSGRSPDPSTPTPDLAATITAAVRATPSSVTRPPSPTRAPTVTPVPEGWVLTQSEPIHRAAYSGDTADVEMLLELGANTGAQASLRHGQLEIEAHKLMPLHLAAGFNSNSEVVGLLLEWGANIQAVDANGRTPLQWAALNAGPGSVELLLEWGANLDASGSDLYGHYHYWRPLQHAAAHNSDAAVTELLLEWGADITTTDNRSSTALHVAARYNPNPDVVDLLLEQGANIEALAHNNLTPLHYAQSNPNPEVVSLLLDRGANIEAQGYYGRTPLHQAALNLENPQEAVAMVTLLLDRGADIEALDQNGYTPLLLMVIHDYGRANATEEKRAKMVELLLDRGANIEAKRGDWTALHYATYYNRPEIAQALLERGADSKAKNSDGATPCQIARQRNSFTGTPLLGRLCRPS